MEATYKKGDVIGGRYEVQSLLGRGGFGEVYSVYSRELQAVYALKTFRQEFLADDDARQTFKREALLWVNLFEHPCILGAQFLEEFSQRLFVGMDYIAPDERGRVTLADHLRHSRGPLDTHQSLVWAIQFCHGMEHANAHGIKCHRDIKPANILIRQDGTLLISDFGLAAAVEAGWKLRGSGLPFESIGGLKGEDWTGSAELHGVGLSLVQSEGRGICGTPGYIAPELLDGAGADVRSDIYSFGLVLWQMAAGSQLPPFAVGLTLPENPRDMGRYAFAINARQKRERASAVTGPLQSIIERCLAPNPAIRFASFAALRAELESILKDRSGKMVQLPRTGELSAEHWNNRGVSLQYLGRLEEAISCYRRALHIDPKTLTAQYNLARALHAKREVDASLEAYRAAVRLQPDYAPARVGVGLLLREKGDLDGAVASVREAIRLDPDGYHGHYHLGLTMIKQGDLNGAVSALRTAVRLQPDNADAQQWLGRTLHAQRDLDGAINAYRAANRIWPGDPTNHHELGKALEAKGDLDGAIAAYRVALHLAPDLFQVHLDLGRALVSKIDVEGALAVYQAAVRLRPDHAGSHTGLALMLEAKNDFEGTIAAWRTVIRLQPDSFDAYHHLGTSLLARQDAEAAAAALRTAVKLDPSHAQAHFQLGVALAHRQDVPGAWEEFQHAYRLDPHDARIRGTYQNVMALLKAQPPNQ
jgi:tetratricopeptide (TPR) repeat protein